MRCMGVMCSRSATTISFMRSLHVSFIAVSGAILITFVPLPLKKARTVPACSRRLKEANISCHKGKYGAVCCAFRCEGQHQTAVRANIEVQHGLYVMMQATQCEFWLVAS